MANYDFSKIVQYVADKEHITNFKVDLSLLVNKYVGITGTISTATISGSNKKLNILFKVANRNSHLHELYINEILFYEVIAPALGEFQQKFNVPLPFDNIPRYYGSIKDCLNECIAMENLELKQYYPWNCKELMNAAHLEMMMETFGKFHATSMAMKILSPKVFNETTSQMKGYRLFEGLWKPAHDIINKNMHIFNSNEESLYFEKMRTYNQNIRELVNGVINYHDKYDVILQGDCWCNNVMYLYDNVLDRSSPKHMIVLDWQMVRTGPVVMDLSAFFYSGACKESLNNLDHYLKLYYNSLTSHLNAFNLNGNEVYPFDALIASWKKHASYGLGMTIIVKMAMLKNIDEAVDFAESSDFPTIKIDRCMEKVYQEQIKNVFIHFVDRNFI